MSSREDPHPSSAHSTNTPSRPRYTPSTPHARLAFEQQQLRSSARRQRSSKSGRALRTITNTAPRNAPNSIVRPDSVRGVLHRLARLTAPHTKRRVLTPRSGGKENAVPEAVAEEMEDEGEEWKKPKLTFEVDEEDSVVLEPPTPSMLPDDEDSVLNPPTFTFDKFPTGVNMQSSEKNGSRAEMVIMSEPPMGEEEREEDDDEDVGAETTFLSERGRRAISEEATGRLSHFNFGAIRMSDFGSELEFRRESDRLQKSAFLDAGIDYGEFDVQDEDGHLQLGGETEDLRNLRQEEDEDVELPEESFQMPAMGDETFELDVPVDEQDLTSRQDAFGKGIQPELEVGEAEESDADQQAAEQAASPQPDRRLTLLETVTAKARARPRKRLRMTRHGTVVPSLPTSLIKRIVHQSAEAAGKRKPVLGKDHMKALEQATEWYFEQVGEDLAAYSSHGRRKKRVDYADALLLMKRQRVLTEDGDLRKMAKDWLPPDMLPALDLPDRL